MKSKRRTAPEKASAAEKQFTAAPASPRASSGDGESKSAAGDRSGEGTLAA